MCSSLLMQIIQNLLAHPLAPVYIIDFCTNNAFCTKEYEVTFINLQDYCVHSGPEGHKDRIKEFDCVRAIYINSTIHHFWCENHSKQLIRREKIVSNAYVENWTTVNYCKNS